LSALWPKYDEKECTAFREVLSSRHLSFFCFRHIGEFGKLLDDRQLMSAFIHFGLCQNPECQDKNDQVKRWLTSNSEIPVTIIGKMEYWRSKIEGWPAGPGKKSNGAESV
jgi:hypothetical protein